MIEHRNESILQFATPRQAEILNALWDHGSERLAADALGIHKRNISSVKTAVKAKAARQNFTTAHGMTRAAPDGYHLKGTTTLFKGDQELLQWVKTDIDQKRQAELMRAAVDAMREEIIPVPALPPPEMTLHQLLNCYVVTDYHLGAKAWGEETGADWDTDIAERLLAEWFGAAIAQAPNARVAVFALLGDFLHWDGHEPVTPTHRHLLDADTRLQRVIRVAIRLIRRIVAMLLLKHESIILLVAEGNHDIASSAWMRELFAALFAGDPRVQVITRPDPYYCVEHGKTSLFFHHGHKRRGEKIETVFIAKFREVFGRTVHSYAHTAHLHHNEVKETNTMQIEMHRTLAAPDSHASRGGYVSGRDAKVITYHADHGEVSRITVSPDMLLAAL